MKRLPLFYPLLIGTSLSLAPAVSLANTANIAPAERTTSSPDVSATHSTQPAQAPTQQSADDRRRYAAREQASPEAGNYRGGDTLVIGASAATAILAVVLLVVLL